MASTLTVSIPMPEELPVTIMLFPVRSIPWSTSSELDENPNPVLINSIFFFL
ncbi:hypothetical protein [Flavobacterium beibuense]|uniref:hypothetical protein n=1 Tax=Flavobacterium beibuense TaxID=657326 RepID=UPI001F5C8926|nr:hypothetical protein [Flavobacterium beibuense]